MFRTESGSDHRVSVPNKKMRRSWVNGAFFFDRLGCVMSEADTTQYWGVRVRATGMSPCAWRRFALPSTMPLAGVHRFIQEAFDLLNSTLYHFESAQLRVGVCGQDQLWMGEDAERWDVTRVTLAELMHTPPCLYIYGDLVCVIERDELPDNVRVAEGEHALRGDGMCWRVDVREDVRRSMPDVSHIEHEARECAGLGGVTMRHFMTPIKASPSRLSLTSSRTPPPEVITPEELCLCVERATHVWSSREELESLVLAQATQSKKTHNLYIRQLAVGQLWAQGVSMPAPVVEVVEGVSSGHTPPQDVTWSLPVHPSLRLLLRMWPVGQLDDVASRHDVPPGGRRRAREEFLVARMCDMERAMEHAQAWSESIQDVVLKLCVRSEGLAREDVLSWCSVELLNELVEEGTVFLGRDSSDVVSVVVPVEMIQVWRLVMMS